MKALLIIGLQVDFMPLGAAEIEGSSSIVPKINALTSSFDLVVAANFSHPADHKMFVANYPWRRPGQVIDLLGDKILLKNYYCIKGTFGAEYPMEFNEEAVNFSVEMGIDKKLLPHSAFFDENRKRDTGLYDYLKQNTIQDLYICGLPLESEVINSATDADELGFNVTLLRAAICAKDQSQKAPILHILSSKKKVNIK